MASLVATTDVTGDGQSHNLFKGGQAKRHFFVSRFGKEFDEGKYRFNLMQTAVVKTADRDDVGNLTCNEL